MKTGKFFRNLIVAIIVVFATLCTNYIAYATGTGNTGGTTDPNAVINNLSDFIFGLIRAIGLIMIGFGVVQVGLSLKSHDPSQRANGFLTLCGGVVIAFTREILGVITGG